jgi:hypothetical protein
VQHNFKNIDGYTDLGNGRWRISTEDMSSAPIPKRQPTRSLPKIKKLKKEELDFIQSRSDAIHKKYSHFLVPNRWTNKYAERMSVGDTHGKCQMCGETTWYIYTAFNKYICSRACQVTLNHSIR